jgi:hypothetical protein
VKCCLAILFSLSLYAPDVAKLVAYADYVVDAVTNKKVNICDCEPILEKGNNADHKDHHIVIKTDWTYTITPILSFEALPVDSSSEFSIYTNNNLSNFSHTIFQPPKV